MCFLDFPMPDHPSPTRSCGSELDDEVARLLSTLASQIEYVGVIGHELRNTVAPLVLLAHELEERACTAPDAPPWIEAQVGRLQKQLGKVVESIETISDVARLSEGRFELQLEEVDLGAVVGSVCDAFEGEARAGSAQLCVDAPSGIMGNWDRSRLEQIVGHLVSNAVRYGGGGSIEICASAEGAFAKLVVSDHGPGIDRKDHARLFERFERVGRRRAGGFGIGLWVVKTLCVATRGTVAVDSGVGTGTRFTCVLPRA